MSPLRKHLEVDGVCSDWFEVFGVVPRGCVLERSFLVVSVLALAVSASRTYGVGQKISCCTVIATVFQLWTIAVDLTLNIL